MTTFCIQPPAGELDREMAASSALADHLEVVFAAALAAGWTPSEIVWAVMDFGMDKSADFQMTDNEVESVVCATWNFRDLRVGPDGNPHPPI